jgi:hypothetical protein
MEPWNCCGLHERGALDYPTKPIDLEEPSSNSEGFRKNDLIKKTDPQRDFKKNYPSTISFIEAPKWRKSWGL